MCGKCAAKIRECAVNVRQKSKNMRQMCDKILIKCGICMVVFGLGDFVRHTNVLMYNLSIFEHHTRTGVPVDILIVSLQPGCSANLGCSANFDKSTWHRKLGIAKFGKN